MSAKEKEEAAAALRITWIGLFSNIAMTAGKGLAGFFGNSSAMLADAAHSFSDMISDVVTLFAVKFARLGVDATHPYGHGKYEPLGALMVGGLLVVTGVGIGHHSFEYLLNPSIPSKLATWAAVISIVVKEVLYQVTVNVGRKQNSQVLIANAWHHRSDAISSVLALVGIVGSQMGITMLDPIAGLIVSGLIVKLGFQTMLSSIKELTDAVIDSDLITQIEETSKQIDGVEKVNQVRARSMGPQMLVDMQIQVDPLLTISAAQQVADKVRMRILEKFPRVSEVLVHVGPLGEPRFNKIMPAYAAIQKDVEHTLQYIPQIKGVPHVLCHYLNNKLHVEVTITVDRNYKVSDAEQIAKRVGEEIVKINGVDEVDVHLELLSNHKIHKEVNERKVERIQNQTTDNNPQMEERNQQSIHKE